MYVQTVEVTDSSLQTVASAQWFETALWGSPKLELMNHSFSLYTEECLE